MVRKVLRHGRGAQRPSLLLLFTFFFLAGLHQIFHLAPCFPRRPNLSQSPERGDVAMCRCGQSVCRTTARTCEGRSLWQAIFAIRHGCGSKLIRQELDRRFLSIFPFTRVPVWVHNLDPQPHQVMCSLTSHVPRTIGLQASLRRLLRSSVSVWLPWH